MALPSIVLSALLVLIALVLYKWFGTKLSKSLPYPPGPPADPLIGHIRFLASNPTGWFKGLRDTFGNIVYLNVLGKPTIVVNTHQIAVDLLEKRGLSYSDGPRLVMVTEILGMALFSALSYTKRTIRQRAMFTTAVIMEIAYGHRVTRDDDTYMARVAGFSRALVNSGDPGATPPDIFPILKHIPAWVPGAWWSQYGQRERPMVRDTINYTFEDVLRQMAEGTASPSFVQNVMETLQSAGPVSEEDAEDVKETASMIYVAGADTTWSTINIFFFAMVLYPNVQKLAQRELDRIIGLDVLPSFNDQWSLPYHECLLQEILRYYPTAPLGLPHFTKDGGSYDNMLIPRGSTVIANTFGIHRDSAVYSDAESFKPERFLPTPEGNGEPHPPATFGCGRRVCPGQWMAEANIWLVVAQTLAMFDIKRAIGQDGKEILPDPEFAFGFVSAPKPFVCDIVPRSQTSVKVIEQAIAGH